MVLICDKGTKFADILATEQEKTVTQGKDWAKIKLKCPNCNSDDLRLENTDDDVLCTECGKFVKPLTITGAVAHSATPYKEKAFLVKEYVKAKKSVAQISEEIHCSTATIWNYLKVFNIARRGRWAKKAMEVK